MRVGGRKTAVASRKLGPGTATVTSGAVVTQRNDVDALPSVATDAHLAAIELPEFQFQLDNPSVVHGAAIEPVIGGLTLEGWVVSRSGIAGIEVRLDDIPLGYAKYGVVRLDVSLAYPDWKDAACSGYTFHFPPAVLQEGQRLVTLTVRARNGQEIIQDFRIDVKASEDADDLIGVFARPGQTSSRYDQILPALLPVIVDQVYRTALCRPADVGGLGHYVHLLATRELDLRRLVEVLCKSQEFLGIVEPVTEVVRKAYRLLFDREPTHAENCRHVRTFRGTCSSDDEAMSLLNSGGDIRARLGIRPIKIEMDITNQCNIRCLMCPFSDPAIGGRKRRDLDVKTFERWADEMFSWAAQVGLMFGTEPTLNSNLLSFVKTAKNYHVPNVYFSTNGIKLTPALAAGLIEAGLDELNVSLDAGEKHTFQRIRRGAKWDTVIGNLRSLRDQKAALGLTRPRLHMSFVMMRSNIRELPQFVGLAAELGAQVVYCTHLVSYDGLGTSTESLGMQADDYQHYIDRAQVVAREHGMHVVLPRTRQARVDLSLLGTSAEGDQPTHLAHIDQAREAHGLAKRVARDEARSCCPFPWHFIAIEPDGSVSPCGWWHAGPPMGNLHTQSFHEIWSGEPMLTLRNQLISRHLGTNCSRCPAAGVGSSDSADAFQSR